MNQVLAVAVAFLLIKFVMIPTAVKFGWKLVLTPIRYDTVEEWLNDNPWKSKRYYKHRLGTFLVGARNGDILPISIAIKSGEHVSEEVLREWESRMLR